VVDDDDELALRFFFFFPPVDESLRATGYRSPVCSFSNHTIRDPAVVLVVVVVEVVVMMV